MGGAVVGGRRCHVNVLLGVSLPWGLGLSFARALLQGSSCGLLVLFRGGLG